MKKKLSEVKGFEKCGNYTIYNDGRVFSDSSNKFLKDPEDLDGPSPDDARGR